MNGSNIFGNFSNSINSNDTISQQVKNEKIATWFIVVMAIDGMLIISVFALALVCRCKIGVSQVVTGFNHRLKLKFREYIYIPCICRFGLNVNDIEGYNLVIDTDV